MDTRERGIEEWIREFAEAESRPERVEEWVERIAAPIVADDEFRNDAALTHSLLGTVRAHWVAFLASLPDPPVEVHLVGPAVNLARELAQRGRPLTTLFRVYRFAQSAVWEHITAIISQVPPGEMTTRVLVYFWSRAASWIDASIDLSTPIWQAEHDRALQSAAAQRLDVVRQALVGPTPDAQTLARALGGHPVSGFNTGVLLHAEATDAVADLEPAARRLARAVGTRAPLVVSPGGRDLWAWLGTRSAPDLDGLRACIPWLSEHRVTAAVGEPAEGTAGFRLSHQEAQEAQRLAFESGLTQALTRFGEVEVLCLMTASRDAALRFTLRTLGDLVGDGETVARLRQTLHTLLRTGSVERAARELSVHKNTVRYRVGQAETLMGRTIEEAPTEVELALRYYETVVTATDR